MVDSNRSGVQVIPRSLYKCYIHGCVIQHTAQGAGSKSSIQHEAQPSAILRLRDLDPSDSYT